jgi:mono/diheme cytochrome c family protein
MRGNTVYAVFGATVLAWLAILGLGDGNTTTVAVAADGSLSQEQLIARGRYLANDVAMCVICHSPRDAAGRLNQNQLFTGAPMPVNSPFPQGPAWADNAPALPQLVRAKEEDVFHLLTTGIRPRTGNPPLLPMPPFRLSEEDARAVIAYLKTVG